MKPRLRLRPEDESLHPLEEAGNFNESMYLNAFDAAQQMGGWFRLGNRPNEGHAEMSCCLYLPGGRVGFMFGRPAITGNDALDAGGMRIEVREPFRALAVSYRGRVVLLDDPLQMASPREAFARNPHVDCTVELDVRGLSPVTGGEPVDDEGNPVPEAEGEAFARGHYEQHVGARGRIEVGGEEFDLDGLGLRDHSWGPRHWQSPWWYRWLTGCLDEGFGFMLSVIASRDGGRRLGGMIFEDGRHEPFIDVEIRSEWEGERSYHRRVHAVGTTATDTYELEGEVVSLIPLRNRRTSPDGAALHTRISEGFTRWRCRGRTGYGMSEYLDQIVDGVPVGRDEG